MTGCSVILTEPQAIPNLEGVTIAWDSDEGPRCYNEGPCWSSEHPTRFTAPTGQGGLYLLTTTLQYVDKPVGERSIFVRLNGSEFDNIASLQHPMYEENGRVLNVAVQIRLEAGEYIEVGAFQDSGKSLNIEADAFGEGYPVARAVFELIR